MLWNSYPTEQSAHSFILHRDVQVRARDAHNRVPHHIPDLRQCPAAGKRMTYEGVRSFCTVSDSWL